MFRFVQAVRKLTGRWARQQETALTQMTGRRTARHRLAGFAKSERIDAKFILLAGLPFVPLIAADEIGWSRGIVWHVWFWLSVCWATFALATNLKSVWRAFGGSLNRKL